MNKLKKVFFVLFALLMSTGVWAQEKTAYAVLSDNTDGVGTKTLTFRYEVHTVSGSNEWDVSNTGGDTPSWYSEGEHITQVVFEESFADARPKSCYMWFFDCLNLTSITGIEYLNTSEVTNMSCMFTKCNSLTSLDVSSFDTRKVTSMADMFCKCTNLTTITGIEYLNTSEVTSMEDMFWGCSGLTSLDLSHFDTRKVTLMNYMFLGCSGLTSLDLSSFNTLQTGDMPYMFYNCSNLTSLILGRDFRVYNNTQIDKMFYGCGKLATGTLKIRGAAPAIDQDIFENVFTDGSLITDVDLDDALAGPDGKYTWKGGKFKGVGKSVSYIDENGESQTVDALPVSSSSTTLSAGWYYVEGDVTINGQLSLTGDAGYVNLILNDGATLTINSTTSGIVSTGSQTLFIYAQSSGNSMGKLIIDATNAAINCYDVSIYGGNVQVGCTDGIYSTWDVVIDGGIVTAEADGGHGINAGQHVIINGGQVTATGSVGNHGIHAADDVIINGGQVTANAGSGGNGINAEGNIILGFTAPEDFIKATSYNGPKVQTAAGKSFNIEGGGTLAEHITLDDGQIAAIAGKKLTPVVKAQVEALSFSSLKGAFQYIKDDGTSSAPVVKIIADIDDESENNIAFATGDITDGLLTLDLNGHTVTYGTITTQSSLTIKDGTLNCLINCPESGGGDYTFTMDNAKVTCKKPDEQNFVWAYKYLTLTNASELTIWYDAYFNGSTVEDMVFSFVDDASRLEFKECKIGTMGSGLAALGNIISFVQPGKTLVVGDGETKNSMILKKVWGLEFVNSLPNSPVKTATVTVYKSATEPTDAFISAPGALATEFNAGEYVVLHIVPEYGFWTDTQLLMATETGASLAPKRALGLELGRPLTLLKADEGYHNGAGWYYYQIPTSHKASAGYISTMLGGFVPTFFMFSLYKVSMSGNVLTIAQEDDPNVGWKAEITFDPTTMSFAFDGNEHKPVVTKIEVKKDNELGATLTADFDNQFTIDGDKRIGKRSIVIHSADNSWFSYNLNTGSTGSGSCGDATFNITIPLNGSGTEDDPWQINNVSDMNLFAQCVNVGEHPFCHPDPTDPSENISEYVKLFNNLSYNEVSNAGFEPIGLDDGTMNNGGYDADFCGIFDGNNKTISNIYYTNNLTSGNSCALGLFGEVNYGGTNTSVIKNLTLNNCTFKGGNYGNRVGALAGDAAHVDISGITITNCTVEGPVTPSAATATYIGGLVGSVEGNSKVSGCAISGSTIKHAPTTSSICNMGGLVGLSHKSEISDCVVENCTLNSQYSNMVGGIVGKVYQATIKDNRVKGNTPISGNTTAGFCRMGAIYGGSEADMSTSTFTNNYYDYGITLGYTHSGGTATANGYTKRGYMNIQMDPLGPVAIGWDDITENDGAKMRVFPVNLSVIGSAAYGKTVEMDSDPSTSDIEAWTAGTNCYSIDGNGHPSIAVGDVVNLAFEPTIYREDDGRTYHAELSMTSNVAFNDVTSFTMPDKAVNLDAVYTEAKWFTVKTNNKNWMSFYHVWTDDSGPTAGPNPANYIVTDPANATTTPTFELLTITKLNGTQFETQNLDGVSYYNVPTLLRGRDADGKDVNLPATLRFDLVVDGSNLREPAPAEEFKGVSADTEITHGIYVMNGNGDFIYGEPDPTDNTLKAHRCYIDLNGNQTNGAPLRWSGETNSIENVELTIDSDSWYTISGMKLNGKPMKQGVYINGGKKVTIK